MEPVFLNINLLTKIDLKALICIGETIFSVDLTAPKSLPQNVNKGTFY